MRLLRIEEAAHRLGLQPSTVRKLIYLREIPAIRPTKRAVRVREEDVEALIRVGYRPAAPKPALGARGRPGDACA
jgi:excisionase family DNA binding protein